MNTARFLKYVWSFYIMQERVNIGIKIWRLSLIPKSTIIKIWTKSVASFNCLFVEFEQYTVNIVHTLCRCTSCKWSFLWVSTFYHLRFFLCFGKYNKILQIHNCNGSPAFKSQRVGYQSNQKLLHHYQHSKNQLNS